MPTTEQRLAALEVFAKGGAYTEPTDTPTPTPEPPTPTPVPVTPTPAPAGNLVDPIPYPGLLPNAVQSGTDLSKLTADATLEDGEYTASGDVKRFVVARNPGKAVLKLKSGQTIQLPDIFAGVDVTGGGIANSDDLSKAGTFAGLLVHSCIFRDSEGFGLLTNKPGCRVTQCEIHHNGSGGVGGTQKGDVLVDNCEVHHNNLKFKRTNSNKWTRAKVTVRDCYFHDNAGRDVWGDNYVQSLTVLRCRFENTVSDKSGDPWKAGNVAGEISDKMLVKDNVFDNDIGGAVYVNEMSQGTVIEGNTFRGKAPVTIEMRDLARGNPHHSLDNVTIRNNTFLGPHASIAPSGAGSKITLSKNRILIVGNVGGVQIKIAS